MSQLIKRIILISLIFGIAIGCRTLSPAVGIKGIDSTFFGFGAKAEIAHVDSTKRIVTYLLNKDKAPFFCAEPTPDVGLNAQYEALVELMTKTPIAEAKQKGEVKGNETVKELGGRTQTILFLREAFYRLCEMNLNYAVEKSIKTKKQEGTNLAKTENSVDKADENLGLSIDQYQKAYQKILLTSLILNNPDILKSENWFAFREYLDVPESNSERKKDTKGESESDKDFKNRENLMELEVRKISEETKLLEKKREILELELKKKGLDPNAADNSNSPSNIQNNIILNKEIENNCTIQTKENPKSTPIKKTKKPCP